MRFSVLGGNAPLLKRQNRTAVLRTMLRFGPLSRRAISGKTGLTASTITNIVAELVEAGLVRELGPAESDGAPPRVGRREVLVDLNSPAGVVVGVHVGVRQLGLALGDLRANILVRDKLATEADRGVENLAGRVAESVERLLAAARIGRERVLGLGAATVGLVDAEHGVVRFAPDLGWQDVPLREALARSTGLPVVVNNSRAGMALAEMMFGHGQAARDFMVVHVGSTIGAGIVVDQRLHGGSAAASGQLGHTAVAGAREPCRCGLLGCLDTVASQAAMQRRALELAGRAPASALGRALLADPSEPLERLYQLAGRGDRAALRVVREAGRLIGLAIADVLSVLDLELVLLAGDVVDACPGFVETVRAEVKAHAFQAPGVATRVLPSSFGPDVRVAGGLSLALHDLFYAPELVLRSTEQPSRAVS